MVKIIQVMSVTVTCGTLFKVIRPKIEMLQIFNLRILCENCQQQSCKAFIGLSICAKMIGGDVPLDVKIWRVLTSGVVVSALASINEVNQRRARLVLKWVTVSGFNSR